MQMFRKRRKTLKAMVERAVGAQLAHFCAITGVPVIAQKWCYRTYILKEMLRLFSDKTDIFFATMIQGSRKTGKLYTSKFG